MQIVDADPQFDHRLENDRMICQPGEGGQGDQDRDRAMSDESGVSDLMKSEVGILVADPIHRRLIEAASTHL